MSEAGSLPHIGAIVDTVALLKKCEHEELIVSIYRLQLKVDRLERICRHNRLYLSNLYSTSEESSEDTHVNSDSQ
jgi:hypothetical protein